MTGGSLDAVGRGKALAVADIVCQVASTGALVAETDAGATTTAEAAGDGARDAEGAVDALRKRAVGAEASASTHRKALGSAWVAARMPRASAKGRSQAHRQRRDAPESRGKVGAEPDSLGETGTLQSGRAGRSGGGGMRTRCGSKGGAQDAGRGAREASRASVMAFGALD